MARRLTILRTPPGNKTPLPVVLLSFGASFAAPEAAVPAVAAAVAGASQHMRVIISMKAAEQQLLKVERVACCMCTELI